MHTTANQRYLAKLARSRSERSARVVYRAKILNLRTPQFQTDEEYV